MKKLLTLISSVAFVLSFSQKTVDAKIITMANDTLNVKVKVVTNMFDPNLIYGSNFNTKIKTIGADGKKTNIEASQVQSLSYTDYNGKEHFFINNSQDKKSLMEILYNGNVLQWLRAYNAVAGGESASDFIFNKETSKGIGVAYFTGLPKTKLKEFFADEPEMFSFIEEVKTSSLRNADNNIDNVMASIIKKYESLKSNNINKQ
ncbi:hypothetical protein [Epilithonimonas mollis]|uniref:DUF4369 domain-containing protein n=1 Tax=Epilithonimonas mollis TaxID=216903 RepID=A0A1M6P1E3_9FLAO|nr:hypothetical protein [Epilithonimonas mollis]SHK01724.1 hypothetical protein SAMN05444371_0798 [Epilithonimonas mollis]